MLFIPITSRIILAIIVFSICLVAGAAYAEPIAIKDLRIWPSPGNTRLVFDLSGVVKYKIFTLDAPPRVVIDFENVATNANLQKALVNLQKPLAADEQSDSDNQITRIRVGERGENKFRVVFETKAALQPKPFILEPTQNYGHRLIVDLESADRRALLALFELDQSPVHDKHETHKPSLPTQVAVTNEQPDITDVHNKTRVQQHNIQAGRQTVVPKPSMKAQPEKRKVYTIALDPGHGGEDPGAIGPGGTREKDVVLRIAKLLKQMIDKEPNMRAFLIRDGDYYVGLRERMSMARRRKADLFISIHADAYEHPRAKGSSVYILSDRGASSAAARWLANSENKADLIGGVSTEDKSNTLVSVLLDLSQAANEKESLEAASYVLRNLGRIGPLHKSHVERAGFAVLKAPDVPSFLVETGFISHPRTEKELRSLDYNRQLAQNMLDGLRKYFASKSG